LIDGRCKENKKREDKEELSVEIESIKREREGEAIVIFDKITHHLQVERVLSKRSILRR
jgi:hypothetical protein